MAVRQLDHLNLSVDSLQQSTDWYGRVFGFTRQEHGVHNGMAWAILRSGEALLCLYEDPERELVAPEDLPARRLHGLSHFGLRIDDREAWEALVDRQGLEVRYGGRVDWPHSDAWYLLDPTGYEIEVVCWHGDQVRFPALEQAAAVTDDFPPARARS